MRILLIGAGGREHALAWKLAQSPRLTQLFIAPGNPGTALAGINVALDTDDHDAVTGFCGSEHIDLVVVGPEVPLVAGLVDRLTAKLPALRCVGPGAAGAQLEGSKAFAKAFMAEFGIPTAAYRSFSAGELDAGHTFLRTLRAPYVLKADGLAAGKGVAIASTLPEAERELAAMLSGRFGSASATVVIEEFLAGREFSVFVITDGTDYQLLPVARDYKRVGEGDTGPNTGGMGAVSPVDYADKHLMAKVRERIVAPTLAGLRARGIAYTGIIFLGVIEVAGEPYVIEYNCRLGDPETEVVLPRLKSDLVDLFASLFDGTLARHEPRIDSRAAATVVLASEGYPGTYAKGRALTGLGGLVAGEPGIDEGQRLVFLAGVSGEAGAYRASGGRVLTVTSFGLTGAEAAETSRRTLAGIGLEGGFFRKDIGQNALGG